MIDSHNTHNQPTKQPIVRFLVCVCVCSRKIIGGGSGCLVMCVGWSHAWWTYTKVGGVVVGGGRETAGIDEDFFSHCMKREHYSPSTMHKSRNKG